MFPTRRVGPPGDGTSTITQFSQTETLQRPGVTKKRRYSKFRTETTFVMGENPQGGKTNTSEEKVR